MDKNDIGKLIKDRRKELKISQEALCDGICNRSALSRIERGEPNVGIDIICQLLDRLGLSSETIYDTENDFDNHIRQVIRNANQADASGNRARAQELLNTIGDDYDSFSLQNRQRYEVLSTMLLFEDGMINAETKLSNLEKSMRLTRPDYTLEKLPRIMTGMESQTLRYIANTYAIIGDYEKAITLYYHLKLLFESSSNKVGNARKLINICYNLSKCLGLSGRYTESIDIAKEGIAYYKYANDSVMIPLCMYNCAWSLIRRNELNDRENAREIIIEISTYCTPMTRDVDELNDKVSELYEMLETQ